MTRHSMIKEALKYIKEKLHQDGVARYEGFGTFKIIDIPEYGKSFMGKHIIVKPKKLIKFKTNPKLYIP